MLDLATPWCLHVAATLRIPEHISAGRTSIAELAAAAGCDRDALHAVLGHLVSMGVSAEEAPGGSRATAPPNSLGGKFLDLDGIGGRMAQAWGRCSTTSAPASRPTSGCSGGPSGRTWPPIRRSRRNSTRSWTCRARHPRLRHRAQRRVGPRRTVVDVGGGTRAMLASLPGAILTRRHPHRPPRPGGPGRRAHRELRSLRPDDSQRAELLDPLRRSQPLPAEERPRRLGRRADRSHPARAPRQPSHRRPSHRWPSQQAAQPQAAQPKGGTIAILGGVSADETPLSLGIDMLVAGGKTSTLTQFTELARQAGLEIIAARTQSSGRFVVECRPAA